MVSPELRIKSCPPNPFTDICCNQKNKTDSQPDVYESVGNRIFVMHQSKDIFVPDKHFILMDQFPDVILFAAEQFVLVEPVLFNKQGNSVTRPDACRIGTRFSGRLNCLLRRSLLHEPRLEPVLAFLSPDDRPPQNRPVWRKPRT